MPITNADFNRTIGLGQSRIVNIGLSSSVDTRIIPWSSYIASFKDTVMALKLAYKNAGLELPPLYCLPEDGINQKQLMQDVIDFIKKQLKKNPNIAKVNAATLALAALYKKYPCQYE